MMLKGQNYRNLVREVKDRVYKAQYEALKAVNKELIALYWDIGRMIVERQDRYGWGKAIVESLARDLQLEFPGVKGFSNQNLWYMRQFYSEYGQNTKLQPLVGEISWAKNLIIMSRCKNALEREFYLRMTRRMGWTKNVLIHQIDNKTYEKTMLSQTNFDKALPAKIRKQAKLAVKDEYTFDFLELGEEHGELELERALMEKVNRFLVEMGGVFTFAGNQFRIEINGKEFFIDIVLYHRRLKCLVAIELKIGEFKPEYAGKMQFYLSALDDRVRIRGENPSIGIILCRDKNRTIVEYALRENKKPIGVATYKITTRLPESLRQELPSPEQVGKLLEVV
jgi:predicted nuclease of restriction endonuclease-like (RecB) superfamily